MSERKIPCPLYDNETRKKVLDTATELFALRGFGAVSMRDISKAVGIQMSSIYYYYESKDALLEEILERFESGYRHYFDWLSDENAKAGSLEEVMDNMFNKEFLEMKNPIGCLGMVLALKEQHNNESARRRVFELFYEHSIRIMESDFARFIEKDGVPPLHTKMTALIFMFCVIVGNDIRIHEYSGTKAPINSTKMYDDLRKYMTSVLTGENQSKYTP